MSCNLEKKTFLVCGIVTYKCDIKRLLEVFAGAVVAFDHVYIYCNQRKEIDIVKKAISNSEFSDQSFTIVGKGNDVGLAQAQNEIACQALKDDCTWITFLDQDSVVNDENGILHNATCAEKNTNTAFVVEYNKNSVSFLGGPKYYNASSITVRISKFLEIGGFLGHLSIDWVDFEFCDRFYRSGGNIISVNNIGFDHQLGDGFQILFGKKIHLRNDTRYYYVVRNAMYLLKKSDISFNFRFLLLSRLTFYIFFYFLKSKDKKTVWSGLCDGIYNRMGTIKMRATHENF